MLRTVLFEREKRIKLRERALRADSTIAAVAVVFTDVDVAVLNQL